MTALSSFVKVYAVWIYLLLFFGIGFGLKVLLDAQRLARTTLFSLDQERAAERTFRALIFIVVLILIIMVVTSINLFLAPNAPQSEVVIPRGPTATLAAAVFPSNTPLPTATATIAPPTETPFVTSTPIIATPTRSARPTSAPPVTATALFALPPPILTGPLPNGGTWIGEGQGNAAITFKWDWSCPQCVLGPDDRFVLTITYTDRTGKPMVAGGGTRNNFFVLSDILRGGYELYQKAQDDKFQWSVQVKRGEQAVTPPSDVWKFVWK